MYFLWWAVLWLLSAEQSGTMNLLVGKQVGSTSWSRPCGQALVGTTCSRVCGRASAGPKQGICVMRNERRREERSRRTFCLQSLQEGGCKGDLGRAEEGPRVLLSLTMAQRLEKQQQSLCHIIPRDEGKGRCFHLALLGFNHCTIPTCKRRPQTWDIKPQTQDDALGYN